MTPLPVAQVIRTRIEIARDLVRRCDQAILQVGDVSLATHLALLRRDLARCYRPLLGHPSEANYLSIVTLAEMALTGKKLRRIDKSYLEAIREALDIGCRKSAVEVADVESVRTLFRQANVDTVPRIDLLALSPGEMSDDEG